MSNKSKIAVITAASIGVVLTQSSSLRAENEDSSAPEKATSIAAPINWDEDVFYSAIPDDALEKAAGGPVHWAQYTYQCFSYQCNKDQPVKKPTRSSSKKTKQ